MTSPPATEKTLGERRSYWCFISYRHADNRDPGRQWATWLHQAIEMYEVPADLVGKQNDRGETIPARIFPVFRDEEELPVDADLAAPIYRALDNSQYLVVICSPRAVQSTYVASEIRYFKRIGRGDRVLAAMIEGEPNASWDVGKQADGFTAEHECFPEPLRHQVDAQGRLLPDRTEPIAADFRLPDGSQGWTSPEAYRQALKLSGKSNPKSFFDEVEDYRRKCELMKLKIIAGILGVALGTLTDRDAAYQLALAQKRARALRRWLAVVGLLAVLAVAGGVVAWQQKREATSQKEQAEQALARSDFLHATDLAGAQQEREAMAYLARSLRTEPKDNPATILAFDLLTAQRLKILQIEGVAAYDCAPAAATLVTATGNTVTVWNAAAGERNGVPLTLNGASDVALALSTDGSRMVITSSQETRVWDTATLKPVTPPLLPGKMENIRFTPDGKRVVATARDVTYVWDAKTGAALAPPLKARLLTTNDPGNLFAAVIDQHVQIWDAVLWQPVGMPFQTGDFDSCYLSPDGKLFATTYSLGGAKVWDTRTGQVLTPPLLEHPSDFAFDTDAGFSPDSKWLATAENPREDYGGGQAMLWEARPGKLVGNPLLRQGWVNSVEFDLTGSRLLTASADKSAQIWDTDIIGTNTSEAGKSSPFQHDDPVASAFFADSGARVVTETKPDTESAGTSVLHVWDARTGSLTRNYINDEDEVKDCFLSSDRTRVISILKDGFRVVDPVTGNTLTMPFPQDMLQEASQLSGDGLRVIVAVADNADHSVGRAQVVDVRTNKPVVTLETHDGPFNWERFSPAGNRVVTVSGEKNIRVWDALSGQPASPPMQDASTVAAAYFSADGKRIVTRSAKTVQVWDAQTGRRISSPMPAGDSLKSALLNHDGTRILLGWQNAFGVWDVASARAVVPTVQLGGDLFTVSFNPDETRILTGSTTAHSDRDDEARVWDANTGLPAGPVMAVTHDPSAQDTVPIAGEFSPEGSRILTQSNELCKVWDAQTGQLLTKPITAEHSCFGPNGESLIVDGSEYDLAPLGTPPSWLSDVLEGVAYLRLDAKGSPEPLDSTRFRELRKERLDSKSSDRWEVFGRWLFSDPQGRTIAPWSSVTVPDYVKQMIAEGTEASLDKADSLSIGRHDWQAQIAAKRATLPR